MGVYQLLSFVLWLQGVFIVDGSNNNCLSLSPSGDCEKCHLGWYGAYCGKKCRNCDPVECHKETGVCLRCRAGYHSTNCSLTCPPQCRESYDDLVFCERTTGNCLEGCKRTWWGDKCEHKCGKQCSDSICFYYDGSCASGCENGLTGTHCNESCSIGCSGGNCSQLSGVCVHGCKTDFYGLSCDRHCPGKCIDSDCSTWNDKTTCTHGCVPGWMPPFCNNLCPPNCLSCTETGECTLCKKGSRCEMRCNCRSGCSDGEMCDGCTDGWRGQTCDLHCCENCLRCQQESGNCTACRQGYTRVGKGQCTPTINVTTSEVTSPEQDSKVPIVIISITVVLIIVAVFIVIYIISFEPDEYL